jgi:UDP-N-acetylglucosamine--N-acetylmuramyl-(pentapeptide) pyrophosphoryl-undecaprenol N-acetylglucosamine transferase
LAGRWRQRGNGFDVINETHVQHAVGFVKALWQARRVFKQRGADAVLGMGGYVCLPGGLMAWLTGRPLMLINADAAMLLSNRVLARFAKRIGFGFDGAAAATTKRAVVTGNPVRAEIAGVDSPEQRFAGRSGPLKLLVVGGSLGAVALNDNVPKALALLPAEQRPQVIHQAGAKNIDALRANYAQAGVAAECVAFIDNMALAYADADLVICRAGALTVAELAAVGVASVLVPYPHAVDDHQTGNAKYLADNHAAVLLPQSQMNPEQLAGLLREMNRDKLLKMAQAARKLAKPHATDDVATVCLELAKT